jgi:hypothetical protein
MSSKLPQPISSHELARFLLQQPDAPLESGGYRVTGFSVARRDESLPCGDRDQSRIRLPMVDAIDIIFAVADAETTELMRDRQRFFDARKRAEGVHFDAQAHVDKLQQPFTIKDKKLPLSLLPHGIDIDIERTPLSDEQIKKMEAELTRIYSGPARPDPVTLPIDKTRFFTPAAQAAMENKPPRTVKVTSSPADYVSTVHIKYGHCRVCGGDVDPTNGLAAGDSSGPIHAACQDKTEAATEILGTQPPAKPVCECGGDTAGTPHSNWCPKSLRSITPPHP